MSVEQQIAQLNLHIDTGAELMRACQVAMDNKNFHGMKRRADSARDLFEWLLKKQGEHRGAWIYLSTLRKSSPHIFAALHANGPVNHPVTKARFLNNPGSAAALDAHEAAIQTFLKLGVKAVT